MTWSGLLLIKSRICKQMVVAFLLFTSLSVTTLARDNFVLAKNVLKSAYPATLDSDLTATVTDQLSFNTTYGLQSFVIQLDRPESTSNRAVRCGDPSAWTLTASFVFAKSGSLHSLTVSGPIVYDAQNSKLRDLVDSHPEWNQEQIMDALKSAGVSYGPDNREKLISALPRSALRTILGDFHIVSAEFLIRDEAQMREHLPSAQLHWLVKMEANDQNGAKVRYFLLLEPFEGRMIQLGKIGG